MKGNVLISRWRFTAIFAAFILLAGSIAFAINKEHTDAANARVEQATNVYRVSVEVCYAGNDTRTNLNQRNANLNTFIRNSNKLFSFVADTPGLPESFKQSIDDTVTANQAIIESTKKLMPRSCPEIYASIRPKGVPVPLPLN